MGKICNYRLLNAFRSRNFDLLRALMFLAWLIALYGFLVLLLLNISGVSSQYVRDSATGEMLPRLENPGLELLTWNLEGPPPVGVNNYFHYRLYLNRLCIIDRSRTRAEHGTCMLGMPSLMPFTVDAMAPNEALSKSRPFGIVGVVDLVAPFLCYVAGAGFLALSLLTLLPDLIGNGLFGTSMEFIPGSDKYDLHDEYDPDMKSNIARPHRGSYSSALPALPTTRQAFASIWLSTSAIVLGLAASCMLAGSVTTTVFVHKMREDMQSVPDVSEIKWQHNTLILIWTATGLVIGASVVLGACSIFGNFGAFWSRLPWFQLRPRLRGL